MRKFILLAVALMVTFVAVPAFASVQNMKISGSLDSSFILRKNFNFSDRGATEQKALITQTTLQADADLTDNVSTTVALINERAWNNDNSTTATDIDLYLAYVKLREMLYSPLTVVIGRQAFSYGNALVVDSTGANWGAPADSGINGVANDLTKQSAMDAVRLIFDYNPLTVELLYSRLSHNTINAAEQHDDDTDLYGINTSYNLGDEMDTQVEAYFFAKYDRDTQNDTTGGATVGKTDTVYTPGLRASTNPLEGLNLQVEGALQRGTKADSTDKDAQRSREAYAVQLMANYQVPDSVLPSGVEAYDPTVSYKYTFVSGQDAGTECGHGTACSSSTWSAWDPMFEAQDAGTIFNSIFELTDMHLHTVGLSAKPMEDVSTTVRWSGLWRHHDTPGSSTGVANAGVSTTYKAPGTSSGTQTITTIGNENYLGYEIDWLTSYAYTEDVKFGLNLGWFNPGDVFKTQDNEETAMQAIVNGNVLF